MKRFNSPEDFLNELKTTSANPLKPLPGAEMDKTFFEMTEKDILENDAEFYDEIIKHHHGLDLMVGEEKQQILKALTPELRNKISSNVAIGALNTGEANAIIVRSDCKKFAILVNYGLMVLLNKFLKLTVAKGNPKLVTYCNRKEASELSAEDLQQYLDDLTWAYATFSAPYGPLIKLKESNESLGTVVHHLRMAELFIICHELGHFLNGDLDKDENFSAYLNLDWVKKFTGTSGHEQEHNADTTGYDLLRRVVTIDYPHLPERTPLQSIVLLSCLLSLIHGDEPSPSHPSPTERVLYIARTFFGTEFTEELKKGYEQPELLDSLW